MKMTIALSLLMFASFANAETKEYDGKNIKEVKVDAPKGEIEIIGTNDSKVKVSVDKIHFDPKCKLSYAEEGSILKVDISQENLLFDKATCSAKIKVEMPKANKLRISTGTSSTKISNITSEIIFKSATGPLNATGLESNFSGTTATGNMVLKYSKCNERADIEVLTASSDTEIHLPSTCKIKVTHKSAAGDLFNEIGESSEYKVAINVKSASGSLKVLKSK